MKRKKFERQQREQEQKKAQQRAERLASMPVVTLNPSRTYPGEFWWNCPNHEGSFTYSKEINFMWGHPEHLVFCAVCRQYYRFEVRVEKGVKLSESG